MSKNKKYKGEIQEGKSADSRLFINNGVDHPPQINPNISKIKIGKKRGFSSKEYYEGICAGDINLLSRAITLIESRLPAHNNQAQEVIERCLPHSGNSFRIGITGVPGVGKSTFIEALGMEILNSGSKLAVLAVDPSSSRSGGSILGDKTRMEQLSSAKAAFIRPSPTAGSLGGVARKTHEIIVLCEAAGYETIFIETVGVGQSETTVHNMVDFFLLLMLAGAGDELQGIKRGIMEMADAVVITKSDGDNIKNASRAQSQYKNALHLFPPSKSGWEPKVLTCSSTKGVGISDVWSMIQDYFEFTKSNGFFESNRIRQSKFWMYETINDRIKDDFYGNDIVKNQIKDMEAEILNGKISSFKAANKLLELYYNKKGN